MWCPALDAPAEEIMQARFSATARQRLRARSSVQETLEHPDRFLVNLDAGDHQVLRLAVIRLRRQVSFRLCDSTPLPSKGSLTLSLATAPLFLSESSWNHDQSNQEMDRTPPRPFSAAPFHTTRWSRVWQAKLDSEPGRNALAELCEAYYEPVVAYLRNSLRDGDLAREVAHAFFARVLEGGAIQSADPERGRFRFYLLGAVKHFLASRREAERAQKRGGGRSPLSLDAATSNSPALAVPDDPRQSPEALFDRQWAVTVLERAMRALDKECREQGKPDFVSYLRPWLVGESSYGDQSAAAHAMGMSLSATKTAIHRLRSRFRQLVKAEVASTLEDPDAVEEEMEALFAALSG